MYKKILGRSVGGTAVAGLLLAAAPVVAGPQVAPMACTYPDAVATQTTLTLSRSIAGYGAVTQASIKVTSGAGTPQGQVRLLVNGTPRATYTLSASGEARPNLPRTLKARDTYRIEAAFVENCDYKASSAVKFYTVNKAATRTKAVVVKAKKARFRAIVKATTGAVVGGGKVAFVLKKNGHKIRMKLARVRAGVARVDLPNLGKGSYTITTKYLSNGNFKVSRRSRSFVV
jgi:hypothetical protein